ncbi:MAG: nitrate/sulfonate/bicarbonate ABC transporter ATP-binding protein, partial [Deltaproteobacteria bacterium]|nr:nitrate/sulfonate/bicarbonate ABC transporter ATP-binding protein [Deltaproteobacteria bacterium]
MKDKKTILELVGISKYYEQESGSRIVVLENINTRLREGEFCALLGPSGAGKSTLIRIIAGLARPSSGQVIYGGNPLKGVNKGVSIVFQSFALFPWLTVLENVSLGLLTKGISKKEAEDLSEEMLDLLGLDGFDDALPKEISGGMKQRVGLARALVMGPELLCMDEPFAGLDVLTAENLQNELLELWLEKKIPTKSILMVTHSMEEAVTMSDRVIIMGNNPGIVLSDIPITLSYPRNRKSPEVHRLMDRVYTILTGPVTGDSVRVRLLQRRFQNLPHARVGAISGFIELLEERGGREDVYELESELNLEADDLLMLTEACKILQFAELKEGDIILTESGRSFALADIEEKKKIFRDAALNYVQLIMQIINALNTTGKKAMNEEFFLEILDRYFTDEEAWKQMETAIDWGRYAELFAYDETSGV